MTDEQAPKRKVFTYDVRYRNRAALLKAAVYARTAHHRVKKNNTSVEFQSYALDEALQEYVATRLLRKPAKDVTEAEWAELYEDFKTG